MARTVPVLRLRTRLPARSKSVLFQREPDTVAAVTTRSTRRIGSLWIPAIVTAVVLCASCVPSRSLDTVSVGEPSIGAQVPPPTLPESGEYTEAFLTQAIVYDLTQPRPSGAYWAPSTTEAECFASQAIGVIEPARWAQSAYQPGLDQPFLDVVQASETERGTLAAIFNECVDTAEAVAAIIYGDARLEAHNAGCLAEGLREVPGHEALASAWITGGLDPMDTNVDFAMRLTEQAKICLPTGALVWPQEPMVTEDERIWDLTAPAGSTHSPFIEDHPEAQSNP